MRPVKLIVGGKAIGEARTWAYPAGYALGDFLISTYQLAVAGQNADGRPARENFSVFRFGVQSKDGREAKVVGLAEQQTHVITAWLPDYRVHSFNTTENGAWRVYASFLIHDGPDNDTELFASIGCVEIMGPQGFTRFNDLLISLMGPSGVDRNSKLDAIGKSKKLTITYEKADRPSLKAAVIR